MCFDCDKIIPGDIGAYYEKHCAFIFPKINASNHSPDQKVKFDPEQSSKLAIQKLATQEGALIFFEQLLSSIHSFNQAPTLSPGLSQWYFHRPSSTKIKSFS
jgi:hypothetical protein